MATHDRAAALSVQLAQAHQLLRQQLRQLTAGHTLPAHCLAFCAALTTHHGGEDTGMFTQLVAERPELAGTVAKLVEDHAMIASILTRVAELSGELAEPPTEPPTEPPADPAAVRRELAGLAAIMESHFRYEERALGAALDAGLPDNGWYDRVFRPVP